MRYDDFRRSDDIDDRRDDGGGGMGGGGGFGLPMGGGGLGIGTIIVLGLVGYAFGIDPRILIGGAKIHSGGGAPSYQTVRQASSGMRGAPADEMGSMISGILGEIDDRWSEIFQASGQSYTGPKVVLFRNVTNGGRCGRAESAMGPFYCPPDHTIFLDTTFFREVETRKQGNSGKSACNFTTAYIIAHEAGHHIQNLLGIIPRVTRLQQQAGRKAESNALQVKVELQADCLSGVWVNREEKKRPGFVEPGDIEAALRTATAIGDDTLQRQSTGRVVPDSFTHGSAAQRKQWFMAGYQQGTVQACNTFGGGG